MKVVLGAAAAVFLMSGAAFAQTEGATTAAAPLPPSRCAAVPAPPTAPDPAAATANSMREAIAAFETWQDAMQPILNCRRAEAVALDAAAQRRMSEFNAANEQLRATQVQYQAATDAFNARRPRR